MHYQQRSPHTPPILRIACCFLAMGFATALPLRAEQTTYKLNDRVETNLSVFGWQKGTVVEVGAGENAGKVKVLIDGQANGFASWTNPKSGFIRKISGAAPAAPDPNAGLPPRAGKYNILSFGPGGKHLYLGHIELQAGGKYRISRTSGEEYFGEGTYAFDTATKSIQWLTGPYKDEAGWGGAFEIDRGGKTHNIQLRKGTIATNSTDQK